MVKQKINNYTDTGSRRQNRRVKDAVRQVCATTSTTTRYSESNLLEQVVEQSNMQQAWQRVKRNKGAAGVDRMNIPAAFSYLQDNWPQIKQDILSGHYKPQPVLCIEIPKPKGGIRKLGIPTVIDRMIQQAILQVLSPIFEPTFSDSSFGFRPRRSAHQALKQLQSYCAEGYRWVVDMDLEKFFDNVNHDILMNRISRRVQDKRVLGLIRRYLQSGIMVDGAVNILSKGTPQGSPLSPLLSNIMLDNLDKELEKRGHKFTRYADDCNIYVRSKRAGERVLESIGNFLQKELKLKLNSEKSAVGRPWNRSFLAYSITTHRKGKLKPSKDAVKRFKKKVKVLFRKGRGRNIVRFIKDTLNPVLRGWGQYFRLSEVKGIFEELDRWIRRRLRCIKWRQWKHPKTRLKMLKRRKLPEEQAAKSAYNGRGPWWNAGASHLNKAFPKSYFNKLGLISLQQVVGTTDWLK
ncbi:group II intron reverse transcriptase/maturase [Sedimentisphaera salicampi]|uniref:RNA-directed DNA polymerase n=1 Tax=Sedimentisphaera salicampi TaxID=1941349 RepID=A0A1W6LKL9_9BACT|nr:group II intron reverse transcriptase/maturase [Sedimentisphaera salicampi]ARN56317.1 Group II intron-encoded protein LtrA [Sedimentisphaera salicampi]